MKKIVLSVLSITLFIINSVYAQASPDTIEIRKGSAFYYKGERLRPKQMMELTKDNPVANAAMKKANSNMIATSVLGGIGGFCIGYPLGAALSGNKVSWGLVGAGAGLVAVAIPFSIAYSKNARSAAKLYNQKYHGYKPEQFEIKLGFTSTGLGLRVRL